MITAKEIREQAEAIGYTFTDDQINELMRVDIDLFALGYYDFMEHFFAFLGKWSTEDILARTTRARDAVQ